MKSEYSAEDLKSAIKNPFYEKLNKEVVVAVRHEIFKIFDEVGQQNGVPAELIMSRCLADYAIQLKEHDN